MDSSRAGLSSAAVRLERSVPQVRQRWMTAHSLSFRAQTATGSMMPPQGAERSPGISSRWRLERQWGQWLRWRVPAPSGETVLPQDTQMKLSRQGSARKSVFGVAFFIWCKGVSSFKCFGLTLLGGPGTSQRTSRFYTESNLNVIKPFRVPVAVWPPGPYYFFFLSSRAVSQ